MEQMTYYDSADGFIITHARAVREIRNHGLSDEDIDLFYEEMGDCAEYDAQEVLRWLGY